MIVNIINKKISFRYNIYSILAFVTFWSYSLYAYGINRENSFLINLLITCFYLALFLFYFSLSQNKNNSKIFIITFVNILKYLTLVLLFVIPFRKQLFYSISGDHFYHAKISQGHGILFWEKIASFTNLFDEFKFSSILQVSNIIIFVICIIFIILLKKTNIYIQYALVIFLFLLTPIVINLIGVGLDPHGPFRTFPLWISTLLFGISDFSLRLPQFLTLIYLLYEINKFFLKNKKSLKNILLLYALGTIPILLYTSFLVEQSIYTGVLITIFLIKIDGFNKNIYYDWFLWYTVVSIFTLIRMSNIILFLPLSLLYCYYNKYQIFQKQNWFVFYPVLLVLPYFFGNFYYGTPASNIPSEAYPFINIPLNSPLLDRLLFSLTSGIGLQVIYNNIFLPGFIALLLSFLPNVKNKNYIIKILCILSILILGYLLFHFIRPILWGTSRYLVEYIIPLIILGYLILINKIYTNKWYGVYLINLFAIILIVFNSISIKKIKETNISSDESYGNKKFEHQLKGEKIIYDEFFFNYKDAFKYINDEGHPGSTYIYGLTYGTMPEIIGGYNLREVYSIDKINNQIKNIEKSDLLRSLIKLRVEYILIEPEEKIINSLNKNNWTLIKKFLNNDYGATLSLYKNPTFSIN